jgi:uncharacterized RDD family membrane protein YckC
MSTDATFPDSVQETVVTATRRRRLAAFLFDHFLLSMLGATSVFGLVGPRWDMAENLDSVPIFPIFVAITGIYFCKDLVGGQSLGRAIFAIAVRDAGAPDETPSAGRLIRRNLLLPLWPVELVALLLSPTRQRIGDRMADTCVVQLAAPLGPRLLAGLGFALAMLAAFMVAATVLVRSSAAYEVATDHLRNDPEVEEAVGPVLGFGSLPAGSIQVLEGAGEAELVLAVQGTERIARAVVKLDKAQGSDWTVTSVRLE